MKASFLILGSLLLLGYSSIAVGLPVPALRPQEKSEFDEYERLWQEGSKVAEIISRELGGFAMACDKLDPKACVYVDFEKKKLTDAQLERLGKLPRIGSLGLSGSPITDIGLAQLKGLTKLQCLILDHTHITDAGLVHLQAMTQLDRLTLDHTRVTDAGLKCLQGIGKLRELSLEHTQVNGPGLAYLKGLAKLEELNLRETPVADAAFALLKDLSHVQRLWLSHTKITGVGLENLKGLSQLESLGLDDTLIDDAGLKHLRELTQLKSVSLAYTPTTTKGLSDLGHALPGRLYDDLVSEGDDFAEKKEYGKAIAAFQEAIKFDPQDAGAHNDLAWMLATCPDARYRDGKQALEHAKRAYELDGRYWIILATLGEAYAEKGDFAAAIEWEKKALGLAIREKDKEICRSRLRVFEQGKPYREAP